MAPRVKVTKDDIINTAIDLIRNNGDGAINARAIANALNCSTQPIFSNFDSMEDLEQEVIVGIYNIYATFLKNEAESQKYPIYKAYGMAYIRFAQEERELFKILFMRDRTNEEASVSIDFEESVQMIMKSTGLSYEKAQLMHFEMWTCVHGIATMIATSFFALEWDVISQMTSDVYQGVLSRHLDGGEINAGN